MTDPQRHPSGTPGGPRQLRRAAQSALARAHVLDAAEAVFARKGFHAATVKEIAQEAEFSVGAVYGFVTSKDELFAQVVDRRVGGLVAVLGEVLAGPAPSPVGQLHALVDAWIGFLRVHSAFARLWVSGGGLPGGPASITTVLEDFFTQGQRSGSLVDGPPDVLAEILTGMVLAFHRRDSAERTPGGISPAWLHALVDRSFTVPR